MFERMSRIVPLDNHSFMRSSVFCASSTSTEDPDDQLHQNYMSLNLKKRKYMKHCALNTGVERVYL